MPEQQPISYEDFRKQQETETRLNVGNQLDVDVEEATRVLKLRGQTGLPYEVLRNDLDYIEKQTELGTFDPKKYRDTNPKWAAFAADNPLHLAVLKDDEGPLTRTEYVLDAMFDWSSVGQGVKHSFASREIGMIGDRQRKGDIRESDEAQLKELNKFTVDHDFDTSGFKSLVVELSKQSANMLGAWQHGGERALVTAPLGASIGGYIGTSIYPVVGTTAGTLLGWSAGIGTGMILGSFEYGRKLEGGHAYLEYRDMGFSHEDAAWAATIAGNVAGLAEAVGANIIFSKLPGVRTLKGSIGNEVVRQLMGRTTFRQVVGKAAKDWGIGVSAEIATEIIQEVTTMTMGEVLKIRNERGDMLTGSEWASRIADIAELTLKSTVLIAGVGPGQRLVMDGRRSTNAKHMQQAFEALGESSKESKLRENLPDKYREFVDKVTEDGPVKNILIDPDRFDTYWQEQGKDPDEMASELGVKNLEQARELGTPIEVPVGQYAEKIAPTEHHAGLGQDIRVNVGDMTAREAEEFEKIKGDLEKEMTELATEADDAQTTENQRMIKDITAQLVASGTNATEAQRQAQIMVGFTNLDQRMGYAPGTLLKRMFAGVRRDLPEGMQDKDFDIYIDPLLNKLRVGELPTQREMMGPSLIDLITEAGGINLADPELMARDFELAAQELGISKAELKRWRKEGRSLDDIAELAAEQGYIASRDEGLLLEAIEAEIRGRPVFGTGAPGDPALQALGERLDELANFIEMEDIDLDTLSNAEVRALLEGDQTLYQLVQQRECAHCFDNSARLLTKISVADADASNYRLVHAWVTNIEGRTFEHGWVERDSEDGTGRIAIDSARDAANPIEMDAQKYRTALHVADVHEYDQESALIKQARSGHFGPWELGSKPEAPSEDAIANVNKMLEPRDRFEQIDFDQLSADMVEGVVGNMPHIFDQQDFGDVAFTDTVRVLETGDVAEVTESAQKVFDRAVKRRNNLRKLLECVSG